jgi:hypothetical protein
MAPIRRVHVYTAIPFQLALPPKSDSSDDTGAADSRQSTPRIFGNLTNVEHRTRRKISSRQLELLEALYAGNTHPDRQTRQQCAEDTGM